MPTEIDILGRSRDVVRHLIRFPLNVLTSRGSARSLRTLLVKILRNAKLRSRISLGHTDKDTALARCRSGQRAWRNKKKPELCFSAVTDEEGHPLENEDESGRRLCEYWGTIFQARCGRPETSSSRRYFAMCPTGS